MRRTLLLVSSLVVLMAALVLGTAYGPAAFSPQAPPAAAPTAPAAPTESPRELPTPDAGATEDPRPPESLVPGTQ